MVSRSRAVDLLAETPVVARVEPAKGFPFRVLVVHLSSPGRPFYVNLECLAPLGILGNRLAKEFIQFVEGKRRATVRQASHSVRRFFEAAFAARGQSVAEWLPHHWESHTNSYIKKIQRSKIKNKSKNQLRQGAVLFLKHLQGVGLVPHFDFVPALRVNDAGKVQPISHLPMHFPRGQQTMGESTQSTMRRLVALSDVSDVSKTLTKIDLLIELLRDHWAQEANVVWDRVKRAREAVASEHFDTARFISMYSPDGGKSFSGGWERELRSEVRVMKLLTERYGGLMPLPNQAGGQIANLCQRLSMARSISRQMHSTIDNVVPFYGAMLLDDLALNPTPVIELKDHSISDLDHPSLKTVRWEKIRSGTIDIAHCYAGTFGDGAITIPQAAACLQYLRKPLQPFAPSDEREMLFLVRIPSGEVRAATNNSLLAGWTRSLSRHPILRFIDIRPIHMRSTHLFREYLESAGDMIRVNAKARHSSMETSKRYVDVNTADFVAARDAREVQDFLLRKAAPNRANLQSELGLGKPQISRIMDAAAAKGFMGWKLCDSDVNRLTHFENWLSGVETIVLGTVEVAAELFAFKRHLLNEADKLRADGSWFETWSFMLLFINAALAEIRPDVRLDGERLATTFAIEY